MTVAILISVLASLTLAPMLASRFMPALRHADVPRKGFAEWLTGGYERGLRWALGHQRLMLVGFAFTVLVAVAGYVGIPKGFFPLQDTAFVFGTSQAAEDISYDDMVAKHRQLAEIIASDPAVQSYNHAVGVTGGSQSLANGRFWIVLKDQASAMSRSASSSTGCARNWRRCRESCSTCARRRTSTSVPDPADPVPVRPAAATAPSWRSGRNASPSA